MEVILYKFVNRQESNVQSREHRFVKTQAFRIYDLGYVSGETDENKRIIKLLMDEREFHRHSGLAIDIFTKLIELIKVDKS